VLLSLALSLFLFIIGFYFVVQVMDIDDGIIIPPHKDQVVRVYSLIIFISLSAMLLINSTLTLIAAINLFKKLKDR